VINNLKLGIWFWMWERRQCWWCWW